jgi:hypothetical protein
MDARQEIHKGFKELIKSNHSIKIEAAKVQAIDISGETVDVELVDGLRLFAVHLTAPATTNKIVVFPKVGSQVFIGQIGDSENRWCVLMVSEVASLKGQLQTLKFEIDPNGVEIKRSGQSLKVVLNDLISALKLSFTQLNAVSLPPANTPQYDLILQRLNLILK